MVRLFVAVTALLLLVSPPAGAAKVKRVAYADRSGYAEAVHLAVRAWNRSQTGIRLVATDDPAKVVVPIASQKTLSGGHAALGGLLGVQLSRERFDRLSLPQQATVVAHVIGHALRIPDLPAAACSVMNPIIHDATLNPACSPGAPGSGRFRCGPNRADGAALAALYGGKGRKASGYCRLAAGRLNAAFASQTARFEGGRLTAVVAVANTGLLPLQAADLGILIGSTIVPLPGPLGPGQTREITYPMCLSLAPARLYSPTFDQFLGDPLAVPVPGC